MYCFMLLLLGCGPRYFTLAAQVSDEATAAPLAGKDWDTISHPDRGHDDAANAVAGAAALSKFGVYDTSMRWVSGDDDSGDAWQRVRLQAPSTACQSALEWDPLSASKRDPLIGVFCW
jgi:hypothetical protein